MWQLTPHVLSASLHRYTAVQDAAPLTFRQVLTLLAESAAFRTCYLEAMSASPFSAFRWETPALTQVTADRPFECVLHDAPRLPQTGDPSSFEAHFRKASKGDGAIAFTNLGGDATLIVPTPRGPAAHYSHLAAFLRHAPEPQRHALLELMATTLQPMISSRPLWLSTAGMGVPWLHIRIDTRPKYYGHTPYTRIP